LLGLFSRKDTFPFINNELLAVLEKPIRFVYGQGYNETISMNFSVLAD